MVEPETNKSRERWSKYLLIIVGFAIIAILLVISVAVGWITPFYLTLFIIIILASLALYGAYYFITSYGGKVIGGEKIVAPSKAINCVMQYLINFTGMRGRMIGKIAESPHFEYDEGQQKGFINDKANLRLFANIKSGSLRGLRFIEIPLQYGEKPLLNGFFTILPGNVYNHSEYNKKFKAEPTAYPQLDLAEKYAELGLEKELPKQIVIPPTEKEESEVPPPSQYIAPSEPQRRRRYE